MYALGSGTLFWRLFSTHFVSNIAQHTTQNYNYWSPICAHLIVKRLEKFSHESFHLFCAHCRLL